MALLIQVLIRNINIYINLNRVTLNTQDLDMISPRFPLTLSQYPQVPPAQSNNNKLDSLSVCGPGPRRESSGTVPHQPGPGVL